jgi:hypothetical protein
LSSVALRLVLLVSLSAPVCAARADHPLITEDADVLGKGVRQIQLHGSRSRNRHDGVATRSTDLAAVLSYGAGGRADVQLELPHAREEEDGVVAEGRGDVSLALKWLFFERDGLKLVLKPDLHLPTGRDEHGLGAGKARWGINAVGGYELGRWEFLVHAGYLRNRNTLGERTGLRHSSVAALLSVSEALTLVLDVGRDTNPDPGEPATREAVLGAMLALSDDVDLGAGIKRGLNDAAETRSVLLGLKVRW